jgi:hypothetical protein
VRVLIYDKRSIMDKILAGVMTQNAEVGGLGKVELKFL